MKEIRAREERPGKVTRASLRTGLLISLSESDPITPWPNPNPNPNPLSNRRRRPGRPECVSGYRSSSSISIGVPAISCALEKLLVENDGNDGRHPVRHLRTFADFCLLPQRRHRRPEGPSEQRAAQRPLGTRQAGLRRGDLGRAELVSSELRRCGVCKADIWGVTDASSKTIMIYHACS
ncbi:hypothetical protein AXG93_2646s1020 [Marchantia polymorpha subsp. ruderalis]|uniref:Uncharacterized protein n=1 Tax=Marchantia polymorpha subsp. ruderalis TaxID=1480154 RepID=A0A176W4Q2_MARPO|nr:hypothetical protein AXG93_2646s1020 [Marchantia polymorpha subsp. ruderalis]